MADKNFLIGSVTQVIKSSIITLLHFIFVYQKGLLYGVNLFYVFWKHLSGVFKLLSCHLDVISAYNRDLFLAKKKKNLAKFVIKCWALEIYISDKIIIYFMTPQNVRMTWDYGEILG